MLGNQYITGLIQHKWCAVENKPLNKAYSPHDKGQGFLAKVNYCKNWSIYPVLAWSQIRSDMHQAFMVHINKIQLFMCEISQNITKCMKKIVIRGLFLAQRQSMFYMHKTAMITILKWIKSSHSSLRYHYKHTVLVLVTGYC